MTIEELQEKRALVKKLKCELKNEEMALVLLKKLKQSQTVASREQTVVSGGATLTPTNLGLGKGPTRSDSKGYSSKNIDLLTADKIVSIIALREKEGKTNLKCLQSQYTKSNTALNNATLLAAAGVDARVLSQMASYNNTSAGKRNTESPVHKPKEDSQTQQQRQAAAKLALRKQLEKTLLQVRPVITVVMIANSPLTDSSPEASPAGDAFHPEPCKHGVHLPVWTGGVC